MIVPSQLALKTHTNFVCVASLATLDKLVDRFPVSPPIGDTSLTHVIRLAADSTSTAMGQSFIITLYSVLSWVNLHLVVYLIRHQHDKN
jgi:hypothetical protein